MTTFASLKDQVESLYVGYFGRTDDGAGTSYWVNQIESGAMTLAKVAESFAMQPEALAKYSYLSAPTISSSTDFIDQVYQQLFNHAADATQGSPQAIGQFIVNVISGATGADDTTIKNKVDVPQGVAPTAPDIGTTSTAPVTAQPPTEIGLTNDTAAPVISDTTAPVTSDTAAITTGIVFGGHWTLVNSAASVSIIYVVYGTYSAAAGVFTAAADASHDAIVSDGASTSNGGSVVFTGLNQALIFDHIL